MKYLIDTPDLLIIQEYRWFWALFCLLMLGTTALQVWQSGPLHWAQTVASAVAMGAMVLGIGIFSKRTVIEFRQSTRQLHWTQTGLFSKSERHLEFADIKQVVVETTIQNNGTTMSRVVVHHGSGQLPLTRAFNARFEQNEALALRLTKMLIAEEMDSPDN